MVINTNLAAMSAARRLDYSSVALKKSLGRLSSGAKIVSPEDDAAGLAQSARLNNQSLRDKAALQVLQNGVSFLQTKDGFLQKVSKALDRMGELSVLALDATKTETDLSNYNTEFQTLIEFISDIGGKSFNDKSLFYSNYTLVETGSAIDWTDARAAAEAAGGHLATITSPGEQSTMVAQLGGTLTTDVWLGATDENVEGQFEWVTGESFLYSNWNAGEPNDAGGNEDYAQLLSGTNGAWNDLPDNSGGFNVSAYVLEKGPSLIVNGNGDSIELPSDSLPYLTDSIATVAGAEAALVNVKAAISDIARQRATVGAALQRIQAESEALSVQAENLDAAVSRISDADVALESTNYARQSILTQSGTAMLAQANAIPQLALRLLG